MKVTRYRSVRVAMLVGAFSSLAFVGASASLSLLITDRMETLFRNVVLVLGWYALTGGLTFLRLKAQANAGYYFRQDLSQRLDRWFAEMPSAEFRGKDHGEWLSMYANDIPKAEELLLGKLLSMTCYGATVIMVFLALLRIHWSVALTALLFLIPMIFVPKLFRKKLTAYIMGSQQEKANYLSKRRELLQGFFMFLENSAFSVFLKKSRKASHHYCSYVLGVEDFTSMMSGVLTFVNAVSTVANLGILSYFVIQGKAEAGQLLAVASLIPSFGSAVMQWMSEREFYRSGLEFYEQRFSMLESERYKERKFLKGVRAKEHLSEVVDQPKESSVAFSKISLQDACVAYGDREIRFPKKLTFEENKHYAIEGESGSGKSTLIKALLGEVPLSDGAVLYDGHPLEEREVFSEVAYASQDTFLMTDTVKNNVDLSGTLSSEEVDRMLREVGLTKISADDMIQENGKNFSGGERQRLALLRALNRNTRWMVLDEITANLDEKTQNLMEQRILSFPGTVVMITHRLSKDGREKLDEVIVL